MGWDGRGEGTGESEVGCVIEIGRLIDGQIERERERISKTYIHQATPLDDEALLVNTRLPQLYG